MRNGAWQMCSFDLGHLGAATGDVVLNARTGHSARRQSVVHRHPRRRRSGLLPVRTRCTARILCEHRWVWLLCRDWLTWEVGDLAGWVATLPRGRRVEGSEGLRAGAAGSGGTRRHGCGWDGLPGQERPDSAPRTTTAAMPVSAILRSTRSFSPQCCAGCRRRDRCRQDGGACRRLVGNEAVLTLRAPWSSGTPDLPPNR